MMGERETVLSVARETVGEGERRKRREKERERERENKERENEDVDKTWHYKMFTPPLNNDENDASSSVHVVLHVF